MRYAVNTSKTLARGRQVKLERVFTMESVYKHGIKVSDEYKDSMPPGLQEQIEAGAGNVPIIA